MNMIRLPALLLLFVSFAAHAVDCTTVYKPEVNPPLVKAEDFGAKGDNATDDTAALQKALDSLTKGGTLVLSPGTTYRKTKQIVIRYPHVTLWGYGATLTSDAPKGTAPHDAVAIEAPYGRVLGVTNVSTVTARGPGDAYSAGILVAASYAVVVDNRVAYTSTGIMIRFGQNYLVARNLVTRTWADGIYHTSGMISGRTMCNTVRQTGDDMISVVNYAGAGAIQPEPSIGHVLIEQNDLAGNYWGNGIRVSGGFNTMIRNNYIQDVYRNACIIVTSESTAYSTSNVRGVYVVGNTCERIQRGTPPYDPVPSYPRNYSLGAIHVSGYADRHMWGVNIMGNKLIDSYLYWLMVKGTACGVYQSGNTVEKFDKGGAILVGVPADCLKGNPPTVSTEQACTADKFGENICDLNPPSSDGSYLE